MNSHCAQNMIQRGDDIHYNVQLFQGVPYVPQSFNKKTAKKLFRFLFVSVEWRF